MKAISGMLAGLLLVWLGACAPVPAERPAAAAVPVAQRWSGDYPVAALDRLPPGQRDGRAGYFANAAEFATAWSAFRPGEGVPDVDFARDIVVFVRNVTFYNQTRIFKTELRDGVLHVLATETLSARPIEDRVAMALAVVPRAGVHFIEAGAARVPVASP